MHWAIVGHRFPPQRRGVQSRLTSAFGNPTGTPLTQGSPAPVQVHKRTSTHVKGGWQRKLSFAEPRQTKDLVRFRAVKALHNVFGTTPYTSTNCVKRLLLARERAPQSWAVNLATHTNLPPYLHTGYEANPVHKASDCKEVLVSDLHRAFPAPASTAPRPAVALPLSALHCSEAPASQ